jgi:hypothetical protein
METQPQKSHCFVLGLGFAFAFAFAFGGYTITPT